MVLHRNGGMEHDPGAHTRSSRSFNSVAVQLIAVIDKTLEFEVADETEWKIYDELLNKIKTLGKYRRKKHGSLSRSNGPECPVGIS